MNVSQTVPFREAVSYWWKLGLTSFGGPAGQISMLHDEVVIKRRWISDKRFLHALNYCMILPGPEAQQLVTYIGWLMHGVRGGIVAGALFVLPSLILLIALSWLYIAWGDSSIVATMFETIKPVVVAVIAQAVYRIGSRSLRHPLLWGIAIVSTALMLFSGSLFPAIVVGAAIFGFFGQRIFPQVFSGKVGHTSTEIAGEPAIIDDDTPTPAHAVIKKRRLLLTVVVSAALWFMPLLILRATVGPNNLLVHMALFFSGAAFLTFGGAYAVLPYVYNGAVTAGWATPSQMVDGLALGETTPGPLIMIVSFVGFIGGYVGEFFGPGTSVVSGMVAAILVTWFTFLPSFFFIIAGGPYVEATRGRVAFTAPLTAINAAVVGVVMSLAITFASHVLVPEGQSLNFLAAAITVAAGVALFGFKRSILEVVGAAAILGAAFGVATYLMA